MFSAFYKGFLIYFGIISAIGAQSTFVIKKGLAKQHVLLITITVILIDIVMVFLGIFGIGNFLFSNAYLIKILKYLGAGFLFFYGSFSLYSAFTVKDINIHESHNDESAQKTLVTIFALSLLNPHLYLDTFLLLPSIAISFDESVRLYFALGAMCSSIVWFTTIGYGARIFIVLFKSPRSWRILDFVVACIMYSICLSLLHMN
jgi:L-lysine exporter family protein LysE/ArgO